MRLKLSGPKMVVLAIVAVSFILGFLVFPKMPAQVASHWNAQGVVDGYMPKAWGLFLMPFVSLLLLLLFIIIPKIDPLKENVKKFKKEFEAFFMVIIAFLFYLYLLTILWNLGVRLNLVRWLVPAFSVLFFCCGHLIEKAKRNWFVGIRNPWTLSSDEVWEKTHRLGGKLFKISGIVALFGLIFTKIAIFLVIIPVIGVAVGTTVFSYREWHKHETSRP